VFDLVAPLPANLKYILHSKPNRDKNQLI